jgi:hypothetical protein
MRTAARLARPPSFTFASCLLKFAFALFSGGRGEDALVYLARVAEDDEL